MGEVYRGRDTQLKRDVALKVLPEALTADADRLARFQREAEVLAALNHPHIAQIYGLERTDPTGGASGAGQAGVALVMELVDGDDLSQRLTRGPIPLDEALPIARQIAEALEAAHEAGIVHRDLKPANIKVRDDGTVKVLDFGLAKALDREYASASADHSPTITSPAALTMGGMILGTAAYMAPEQARGKPVDKRADIWAFGCVLYEMLTGRRAFPGEDVSETLAAVIRGQPDCSALPPDLSPALRLYLARCLEKDPRQRLRDIGDMRLALGGAFDGAAPSAPADAPAARWWQRPVAVGALVVAGAATAGAAAWLLARPSTPPRTVARFSVPLAGDQRFVGTGRPVVVISPGGDLIAYTAGGLDGSAAGGLWLRRLHETTPSLVAGSDDARNPFFSADGRWLGFWSVGRLRRVSTSGGAPVAICDSLSPYGVSWGVDDAILYGQEDGIWRVSGSGGASPERVVSVQGGERVHGPQKLPGGDWILFTLRPDGVPDWNRAQIVAESLTTRERRVLVHGGRDGRYLATGHLVYAVNGTLLAAPFDAARVSVGPGTVSLVEGLAEAVPTGAVHFSVSDTGSLVYARTAVAGSSERRPVVWVDRNGRETPVDGLSTDDYQSVALSPDGSRLALEIGRLEGADIQIYDLVRRVLSPLTTGTAPDQSPVWTPDGRQIVFQSRRSDVAGQGLYRQNADGTGDAELLFFEETPFLTPNALTRDGGTLVFVRRRVTRFFLSVLSIAGRTATDLPLEAEYDEHRAALSPDGRWIAYQSNRSRRDEIYVERFPGLGDRQMISSGGGQRPVWSADGREVFYLDLQASRIMSVPVAASEGFKAGTPQPVAEVPVFSPLFSTLRGSATYDVAPDGQRFVVIRPGEESANVPQAIDVVINWTEELLARVPRAR